MSANLLADGTILIAGGNDDVSMSLAICERYDPLTEAWTQVGDLTIPRIQHTTHLLPNGSVLAVAGYSSGTMTSSVEIFSPVTNSWQDAGNINVGRMNHTSTMLLNGKILVVGGYDGYDFLTSCELYDPVTATSSPVAPLNVGRHDHNAILLQSGKVMITGGRIGGAGGIYLDDVEIYDPTTDTWTQVADMNSSRIIGTLVEFGDQSILAAGGRATANSATTSADLFDPISQTWNAVQPMRERRHWQGESLMPHDRYLITGGIKDAVWTSHNDVEVSNTCEWYDKSTNSWFYAPDMEIDRSQHGQIYFTQTVNTGLPRECVIVIGGLRTGYNTFTGTCEILNVTPPLLEEYKISPRNTASVNKANDQPLGVRIVGNGTASPVLVFDDMSSMTNTKIDFVNAQGVSLSTIDLASIQQTGLRLPLDIRNISNGIYFLRVTNNNQRGSLKLIVSK